jgi:hypothetical protein
MIFQIFVVCAIFQQAFGHGWMREPVSRSSAWRLGFPTPRNFDDDNLACGGFLVSFYLFEIYIFELQYLLETGDHLKRLLPLYFLLCVFVLTVTSNPLIYLLSFIRKCKKGNKYKH